jgi:GNAT superfamily N-acetyltransferase
VDDLRRAESVVVHGFDLPRLQPYRAGEAFPDDLLWYPGVRLFLASREDTPVGACLCVAEGTCGGIYWVTTLPEHRSTGVGRAVMAAALAQLAGSAVSLTATAAGEPLYRDLGFRKVAEAAWWLRADSTADPDPG